MRVISDHDIGTDADDANIRHNYKHQHHKDPFNDDPEHQDVFFSCWPQTPNFFALKIQLDISTNTLEKYILMNTFAKYTLTVFFKMYLEVFSEFFEAP